MLANPKRPILVLGLIGMLSSCANNSQPNNDVKSQPQTTQVNNQQLVDGNTAEYTMPDGTQGKADYKKAVELNSELAILYSQDGYLDRAKEKLIKAQDLAKEHDYELAIVGYAAGYYYQTIGANSIAEKYYKDATYYHPKNFEAINFYAQFLCQVRSNYREAQELFDKSLYLSTNNDMAQTLFLYSECMYKQGKKDDALMLMQRADKFRTDYRSAKLRLAEMYFDRKDYRACYKVIYGMKDDKTFFNSKQILELRLKLAEYAHNRNEAATVRLLLSSKDFNDEGMKDFFSASDDKAATNV